MQNNLNMEPENEKVDSVLSYILMKKLITPIKRTPAFKLGLVDREGDVLKKPETEEEVNAITTLDKLVYKLKKLLGSKLAQLNRFMYLLGSAEDVSSDIHVMGGVEKRGVVKRIQADLETMFEKYDISAKEFFNTMLVEEIRKKNL